MEILKFYEHSNVKRSHQVSVHYEVGNKLEVSFKVETNSGWNTKHRFGTDPRKNWGLWDYDVVECFFGNKEGQYLEVQLSPLSQGFNLVITEPRKIFYTPLDYHPSFYSEWDDKVWKAKMSLPIDYLDIEGDLYGNFFACLGKPEAREYFALNTDDVKKTPDFHRPELFIKL